MADKPILFNATMVSALLAGTKTQTRRLFKPQPTLHEAGDCTVNGHRGNVDYLMREIAPKHWLRIAVGDRLWVREAWVPFSPQGNQCAIADATYSMTIDGAHQHKDGRYTAGLGEGNYAPGAFDRFKWRPSIHMPRWASRLTVVVSEVRVQRLQEITEEDAKAEGATFYAPPNHLSHGGWSHDGHYLWATAKLSYSELWNEINGTKADPHPWDANPWVAAYTFSVEHCNIDLARAA